MIICECCFKDPIISSIIRSLPEKTVGDCPVCGSRTVSLYDTEKQSDLTPYFEDLLRIYTPSAALPEDYPEEERCLLLHDLRKRWDLFADISDGKCREILLSICSDLGKAVPAMFDDPVGIQEGHDPSYLMDHALLRNSSWEKFVEEIKTVNRYHSKFVNFEILERFCSFIRKKYRTGERFYRARISDREGYPPEKMSAPPAEKSTEGRANARGITCLYLADDTETTLREVRAGVFDYVSVGTFQLMKDITVVNLRDINKISPFIEGLDCMDHAINKQYLEKLDAEMSKPLRRADSTLDYVPTQYFVDFIKSIDHDGKQEYDGIEYNSTTYPGGFNLAIFDPDLFECIGVDVYDIDKLTYTKHKL